MTDAVLREKAMLLLKRERELLSMRQKLSWTASWLGISEDTATLVNQDPTRVEVVWPQLLVDRLKYQQALLTRLEPECLQVLGAAGACGELTGTTLGCSPHASMVVPGRCNEPGSRPSGWPALFARFMWCPMVVGNATWVAVVGFDERTFRFHPVFEEEDLAYFRMACRQLEALTLQSQSIRTLSRLNEELRDNDTALRAAREALLASTRLAAVGAMAGRTAHEVLNPLTGIQGRVDLMKASDERLDNELNLFKAIVAGWRGALLAGGLPNLMAELSRLTPEGHSLAEDDLSALEAVSAALDQRRVRHAESITVVRREIDRIAHTVDGLRGLSRAHKTTERLPIEKLLAESIDVLAAPLARACIAVVTVGDLATTVLVDRYEFIQVVTNLLRNALFAIEGKGKCCGGAIRLTACRDAHRLSLFVEDDGIGIAPEHVPLLFEQQFTTRSAESGTGLGLSIARGLARQAHGDLRLSRSEPGRGSTFVLELPIAAPDTGGPCGHAPHR